VKVDKPIPDLKVVWVRAQGHPPKEKITVKLSSIVSPKHKNAWDHLPLTNGPTVMVTFVPASVIG
jgi:hypothetical protein